MFLIGKIVNNVIDEAVKVAENNDTGAGTDVDSAGYEIAYKIKELKE